MRKPRILIKNAQYHVTARINRGQHILEKIVFKELFLDIVARAMKKYNFRIINFCIMDNHVHFIMHPGEKESLSRIMQWILSVFAKYYNNIMNIKGHVWYDRFKSKIIKSLEQMIFTFNYINQNPVKAKLVKNIKDYNYSGISFIKKGDFRIITHPPDYLANFI